MRQLPDRIVVTVKEGAIERADREIRWFINRIVREEMNEKRKMAYAK